MASNNDSNTRQTNPLQGLFDGISKIFAYTEFKDLQAAKEYETVEIADKAAMWINANDHNDTYLTYHHYWTLGMFQEVNATVKKEDAYRWMDNPYTVPLQYHTHLLECGRNAYLSSYVEENRYYRMLIGLPPLDMDPSEYVYLSEPTRNQLHATDVPVHELSSLIQNSYIATEEYKQVIRDHPEWKYLKYLGRNKIPLYTARDAKDFEIIRYPHDVSDINPNLLKAFAFLYDSYREYVMTTLYNYKLEELYPNYRTFMRLIIQMFVVMQVCNKAVEAIGDRNYLDDAVLHIVLSMYDIPDTLIMTNDVRRKLATSMLRLIREKGTDEVYNDLVEILGYQDIAISKLMLMKGQRFDENGNVIDGNNPYFIQLDINDKNPYETIASGKAPIHDYHAITDPDPTWWDIEDTRDILANKYYSETDSKYIMIDATIHQYKFIFESIYFMRLILDNKMYTDGFMIEVPELFGTKKFSIYDLMVYILAATCMNNGMSGDIYTDESYLLATAGFNFDLDFDSFEEFLNTTKYVDLDRIRSFMENLTMTSQSDINRLFNDVMIPLRTWLEEKISRASCRGEYVEYEAIYRALFTYDLTRNMFLQGFKIPMDSICEKYDISENDIKAYQHFYPSTLSGETITVDSYKESRYHFPFLSRKNVIDYWIHITVDTPRGTDDRGYVYLYDILNMSDLRELTNPDGTRPFMDYIDPDIGWEVNTAAVNKAIELIDAFDEDALSNAYFQVETPIRNSGGERYEEGEKLPPKIRTGIYKEILKDKILMDMQGLAVPPKTYLEYLERKNPDLYRLLTDGNRFYTNKESWMNDVMRIVMELETNLNMHLKYFEQSVVGTNSFFKPLITLINYFKSTFVQFAKSGLKYVFSDKMDAGGNSNMFKLFDEVKFVIHFVTLANRGFGSQFGIYDTEHKVVYRSIFKDRRIPDLSDHHSSIPVDTTNGSIRFVDEMKFFKNGEDLDPSGDYPSWYSGEPGTGRWIEEDNVLMQYRKGTMRVKGKPVDTEGWKDYVKSYMPPNV